MKNRVNDCGPKGEEDDICFVKIFITKLLFYLYNFLFFKVF